MSKRKKSRKDNKDQAIQTSVVEPEKVHKPRKVRAHLSQELRDRGFIEEAESVSRHLLPHARNNAQGTRQGHYVHKGWVTTQRREIVDRT